MVTIQPLHFEKVTAFKERIQLLNKINEIIAELENYPTETEMSSFVANELTSYYTKEEVDELIAGIDLSDYYTKEEVNTINNLVNYYNITQLNATFEQINDRITSGEETLEDEIAGKQDLLTAGSGISIVDNVISSETSLNDFVVYNGYDLVTHLLDNNVAKMDFYVYISTGSQVSHHQINKGDDISNLYITFFHDTGWEFYIYRVKLTEIITNYAVETSGYVTINPNLSNYRVFNYSSGVVSYNLNPSTFKFRKYKVKPSTGSIAIPWFCVYVRS